MHDTSTPEAYPESEACCAGVYEDGESSLTNIDDPRGLLEYSGRIEAREFANVIRLTPLVAIDLIVRSPQQRVLVGRRINEPAKGLLFVPGSRISKNETRTRAFI